MVVLIYGLHVAFFLIVLKPKLFASRTGTGSATAQSTKYWSLISTGENTPA